MAKHAKGEWRTESVSDCVRVCVGTGRSKIILARLAPKQIPEAETLANAQVMACAPAMAEMLLSMFSHVSHGGPTRAEAEALLKKAGMIDAGI